MSTLSPARGEIPGSSTLSQPAKSQRVLACVLCQKRKLRCDRQFPCSSCLKSRAQCVPAVQLPRRRRRRFPERELLERLRKYEHLLRQNGIKFDPLHREGSSHTDGGYDSDNQQHKPIESSPSATLSLKSNFETVFEAKNIWEAMSQGFRDPENDSESSDDEVPEVVFKNAWIESLENCLTGSRKTAVDISTLHPDTVQIFRLWQIYLDNVNPLLKVTYTPALQGRVIEAASNISKIPPTLEALMFGIYCISIASIDMDDCQTIFHSSRTDLLTKYQFGCQQALMNCDYLRNDDIESLTAFYFYMLTLRGGTVPQALCAMLGMAIRIAKRIGIHSEATLTKQTALDAEIRRRLWWSIVLFDARVSEMADYKSPILLPTWDCKIPLNVNDSEFQPEMKEPPQVQGKSTEALFAVVRSELGDYVRHSMFHLDFTSPALKPLVRVAQQESNHNNSSELDNLAQKIEDEYLSSCDQDNPLHYMTIWTSRAYIAKQRLIEYHSKISDLSNDLSEDMRDAAFSNAMIMLQCDTNIVSSPLTKRFVWLTHFYFPFTGYIHILKDLKRRPARDGNEQAWSIMNQNFEVRFNFQEYDENPFYTSPFFKILARMTLQSWEARGLNYDQVPEAPSDPRIIAFLRDELPIILQNSDGSRSTNSAPTSFGFPTSSSSGTPNVLYGIDGQDIYSRADPRPYPGNIEHTSLDIDVDQIDWTAMDWGPVNTFGHFMDD